MSKKSRKKLCFVCGSTDEKLFKLTTNPQTRDEWINFCGGIRQRSFFLCAVHFDEQCFLHSNTRTTLRRAAVPTLNRPENMTLSNQNHPNPQLKDTCCVCGNRSRTSSYFNFPKNDTVRKQWLKIYGFQDVPNSFTKICDRHFLESDILRCNRPGGRTRLQASAVPQQYIEVVSVPSSLPCGIILHHDRNTDTLEIAPSQNDIRSVAANENESNQSSPNITAQRDADADDDDDTRVIVITAAEMKRINEVLKTKDQQDEEIAKLRKELKSVREKLSKALRKDRYRR